MQSGEWAGPPSLSELVRRAGRLGESGGRRLLGITGPPGAGKTTLAAALAGALDAVIVPMDGFHLDNAELRRLNRLERKGAQDTFDAAGYVGLLRELRTGAQVRAPAFDRAREETVPDAIDVPRTAKLVITEGNCWTRSGTSTIRAASSGWWRGTSATAGTRPRHRPGPRSAATRSTRG